MRRRVIASLRRQVKWRKNLPMQRSMSTETTFHPSFDPFTYTQGRWLDRDQEQRKARRLQFNFDALLDEAVRCSPGAERVIDCEKREGGFNRVFMIHLDNKATVVARLPTRIAGPPRLTVSSEVATLRYGILIEHLGAGIPLADIVPAVKEKTTIPVPNVLSWSANPDNDIGAEYMILDLIPGISLRHVWNEMKASEHVSCIRSIGLLCAQLCELDFPLCGSLYLNTSAPPGAIKLDQSFCIGPVCAPQHWDCGIDSRPGVKPLDTCQGPWHDTADYLSDLIARPKSSLGPNLTETHSQLLDTLHRSLSFLVTTKIVEPASGPILSHPDLHTRNIFVDSEDHTKITGIIDWQSAAIEPAFVFAAEIPDFAEELPDHHLENATDEVQAAVSNLRLDVDFCVKAWAVMQQACEKLRPASRVDYTLLRALAAPSFGWADKEVVLETFLHDLANEWEKIGLPGQSIYRPCTTDDDAAAKRLDDLNAKRKLQNHLVNLLHCGSDGWVPNDRWEEVLPLYLSEYDRLVESVKHSEDCKNLDLASVIKEADLLWPFDHRRS